MQNIYQEAALQVQAGIMDNKGVKVLLCIHLIIS